MLEAILFGLLTGLVLLFFFRWREEKRKGVAWKNALAFAQQEVARCQRELQHWAASADRAGGRLQHTELRLPNLDDLLDP
jgi:hypothetical protein